MTSSSSFKGSTAAINNYFCPSKLSQKKYEYLMSKKLLNNVNNTAHTNIDITDDNNSLLNKNYEKKSSSKRGYSECQDHGHDHGCDRVRIQSQQLSSSTINNKENPLSSLEHESFPKKSTKTTKTTNSKIKNIYYHSSCLDPPHLKKNSITNKDSLNHYEHKKHFSNTCLKGSRKSFNSTGKHLPLSIDQLSCEKELSIKVPKRSKRSKRSFRKKEEEKSSSKSVIENRRKLYGKETKDIQHDQHQLIEKHQSSSEEILPVKEKSLYENIQKYNNNQNNKTFEQQPQPQQSLKHFPPIKQLQNEEIIQIDHLMEKQIEELQSKSDTIDLLKFTLKTKLSKDIFSPTVRDSAVFLASDKHSQEAYIKELEQLKELEINFYITKISALQSELMKAESDKEQMKEVYEDKYQRNCAKVIGEKRRLEEHIKIIERENTALKSLISKKIRK